MVSNDKCVPEYCGASVGLMRRLEIIEKKVTRREHKARVNDAQLAVIADRLDKIDRHLSALIRALSGVGAVTDLMSGRGMGGK